MSSKLSPSPPLPLSQLRLLPLIAGTSWFITLLALLIYWLAEGRPRYPGQSNPYVAFISEIGAFRLQPLFTGGGTLTSLCLTATVIAIHHHYHLGNQIYNHDPQSQHKQASSPPQARQSHRRYKKFLSALAILFATLSSPCQIALTVFDNHGQPKAHRTLLFLALGSTTIAAISTSVVFSSETLIPPRSRNARIRRNSIILSNALLVLEVALGVAFTVFLWLGYYRVGGIVEWVMMGIFGLYFMAFWGFLLGEKEGNDAHVGDVEGEVGEETPLLK